MIDDLSQTAAPQELKIELGDYTLFVPDLSKPVWFGPYHDGKLGIFEVQVTVNAGAPEDYAAVFETSVTYLAILTEADKGNDFVMYTHYLKDTPVEDICIHLQRTVYDAYLAQLVEQNPSTYVPGTDTVQ